MWPGLFARRLSRLPELELVDLAEPEAVKIPHDQQTPCVGNVLGPHARSDAENGCTAHRQITRIRTLRTERQFYCRGTVFATRQVSLGRLICRGMRVPTDPGAGEWGSQPWYDRFDDAAYAEVAGAAVLAADAYGYTHAAAHLAHYLDNTGADLPVDVDTVLHDVPDADISANQIAEAEIRQVAIDAIAASDYGTPVTFQSKWGSFYISQSSSADWFFAMGGIRLAASGAVTTQKTAAGAEPNVVVAYQIHIYDRYNWDDGKSTDIAGVTVTDKSMADLQTAGLAREYDIEGSSKVRCRGDQIRRNCDSGKCFDTQFSHRTRRRHSVPTHTLDRPGRDDPTSAGIELLDAPGQGIPGR